MDNCCLNRPFDDQSNPRVHLESEAIKIILNQCEKGNWKLISSDIINYEISKTSDDIRKKELSLIISIATEHIKLTDPHIRRSKELIELGLNSFDALHISCAESESDIFMTVDDQIIKRVQSIHSLKIKILNPIKWLEEVLI